MTETNPTTIPFPSTPRRCPSKGYSQSPARKFSSIPWETFVADSVDGSKTECLLCGRISARNTWRTRAHFTGGDHHVQLCSALSSEVQAYLEAHPPQQGGGGRRKTDKVSSPPRSRSQSLTSINSSISEEDDFCLSSTAAASSAKFPPMIGFSIIPEEGAVVPTWKSKMAFNLRDSQAQCLLCNRVSKSNPARLKAHFFGGDKHVAVCPAMMPSVQQQSPSKRKRMTQQAPPPASVNRRENLLEMLFQAATAVECTNNQPHLVSDLPVGLDGTQPVRCFGNL